MPNFRKVNNTEAIGSSAFHCKQGYSISFDEKGQFRSCVISDPVGIRTGNAFETCPQESRVYVSTLNNGHQSISCN